jgi:hypothetical protein
VGGQGQGKGVSKEDQTFCKVAGIGSSFVPLSENTAITAISSLLVLPLCVWQVEAFAYISQEGKVERANDNTKVWSVPILFLLLLFFNLFCHPAKDDFACKSFLSSS